MEPGLFKETWESFGKTLEEYINKKENEFRSDSFDVIIGFSRGGTILASIISCLLKDKFEEYFVAHKASFRPIPKGLSCKRDDPCFVMNLAGSTHEIQDINENLENELKKFAIRYNNDEPISVLVVDDNLTGATRITYIGDKLKEMGIVKYYKLLAYNHHPDFKGSKIEIIREFPLNADVFAMPWHTKHTKRDLVLKKDDNDKTKLNFYIKFSNELKWEELYEHFKTYDGYKVIKNPEANIFSIKNGASQFNLTKGIKEKIIVLSYTRVMFYPPKKCIKPIDNSNNNNKDLDTKSSLCLLGATKTKNVCLICSYLNCNTPLIKKILTFEKTQPELFIEELPLKGNVNKSLKPATENWFKNLMPMKIMQSKDEL